MNIKDRIKLSTTKDSKVKTVYVRFSDELFDQINQIQKEMNIESRSETIRALAEEAVYLYHGKGQAGPGTPEMALEFEELRKKHNLSNRDIARLMIQASEKP